MPYPAQIKFFGAMPRIGVRIMRANEYYMRYAVQMRYMYVYVCQGVHLCS